MAKEHSVMLKDGKMFYRYAGDGDPLILIHSVGFSSELWYKVMEPLAEHFTVYAIDLIGHGDSDKPDKNYYVIDHATSIKDFMDLLSIEKANIMGSSLGGLITLEIAASFPEKIIKTVIVAAPALNEPIWDRVEGAMRIAIMRCDTQGNPRPLTLEGIRPFYANPTEETVKWANRMRAKAGKWCWKDQLTIIFYEIMERMPLVRTPTLVFQGKLDGGGRSAEIIAENIKGSMLSIVDGLSHFPQIDDPDKFLKPIVDFLLNS